MISVMPKAILYLILAEGILAMLYNVLKPGLPHIPGDIYFDKSSFRVYIPFVSAIVLSVLMYFFLGHFIKGF